MRKPFVTKDGAIRVTYRMGGSRKTLHLGTDATMAFAYEVQETAELLASYRDRGEPVPDHLLHKIKRYPVRIRESFRRQGLFEFMKESVITLRELIAEHEKMDVTANARADHSNAFRRLLEYFDAETFVEDMDEVRIESFGNWLETGRERKLSPVTIRKTFKNLRKAFRDMKRRGMTSLNPFEYVKAGSDSGEPSEYVERETVLKTLEWCVHPELRMAVVFARFAGLRIPCEIRNLKGSDIGETTFHVCGKTGSRTVPLFHRVAEELKMYKIEGEYLFPEARRRARSWLSGLYETALRRSGVVQWSKLMNSLRASCITDYEHEGVHEKTLNSIFGNSRPVRLKHYIKVRNIDYEKVLMLRFEHEEKREEAPREFVERLSAFLSGAEIAELWKTLRSTEK